MFDGKKLFVALSTAALLTLSTAPAEASNQTCPDGQTEWFFYATWFSGWDWADQQAACDAAWSSYASSVSIESGPHVDITYHNVSPDPCNPVLGSRLHCSVCIDGYAPAWAHEVHELAPLDAGGAGDIAVGEYPGKVVSIELDTGGSTGGSIYTVKVVTYKTNDLVEVRVDGRTGKVLQELEENTQTCSVRR